MGEINFKISI